ncbi:MAG TPA: dephospho-CoA kinase [Oscillospiraceae bacterium]|nr:dephospho-CoA kinase [Oscillospiraceae bacterium]
MKIIGITGGSGAGKTTALGVLAALGVVIVDCDALYHGLLERDRELHDTLVAVFGDVTGQDGRLDRKKLGAVVFRDAEALEELNAISHAAVLRELRVFLEEARAAGETAVAIDAIALLESGVGKLCDCVVGIVAPEEVRVRRLMARDGISRQYALLRIRAQKPERFFRKKCDYILENQNNEAAFANEAERLFRRILNMDKEDPK